tara:strand:- start:316 stop:651 length:336 start_codon:yes stop_codon:yes gene_type:complete
MMREKPSGDSTHSGETGDLVAKALGWDDGDILGDALVGVEVEGQARVVLLDDDAGRLRIEEGGDATSERDCGITTRVFRAGPVVPSRAPENRRRATAGGKIASLSTGYAPS